MVRKGHWWPFKKIKICFLWLVGVRNMICSYTPIVTHFWVLYYWFRLGSSLPSFSLFLHFPSVPWVLSLHTTRLASLSHWTIPYKKKKLNFIPQTTCWVFRVERGIWEKGLSTGPSVSWDLCPSLYAEGTGRIHGRDCTKVLSYVKQSWDFFTF
jgi:hypothetical protein